MVEREKQKKVAKRDGMEKDLHDERRDEYHLPSTV